MNTRLQKLFENSSLSDKDKYEVNQIFELLPPDKKQNILDNFDVLAFKLTLMHKEIELERRILI
jgi:predicted Zn-ribbon and HTH transcriptional regulator